MKLVFFFVFSGISRLFEKPLLFKSSNIYSIMLDTREMPRTLQISNFAKPGHFYPV